MQFTKQHDEQIWISGYKESLSGKSEGTIDAYLRIVKQFVRWVTDKPGGEDGFNPILFTRTAVEEYFKNQISNASISHKQRVKTVLNDFANWLMEQDAIKKSGSRDRDPSSIITGSKDFNT